jgi:hypothetical protein
MIDPEKKHSPDEEEEAIERKPELDSEKVKDLTPPDDDTEEVRGGDAGPEECVQASM